MRNLFTSEDRRRGAGVGLSESSATSGSLRGDDRESVDSPKGPSKEISFTVANSNPDPRAVQEMLQSEPNPDMQRIMKEALCEAGPGQKRVSREVLLEHVREEAEHRERCMQIPLMVLYFVFYVFAVFQHEEIRNSASVERNVRNMLEGSGFEGIHGEHQVSGHKTMDDIDTITDVWTFLYDAVVPLFIPSSAGMTAEGTYRVLRYSQLFGGVQLQQLRRPRRKCQEEYPSLGPLDSGTGRNPLLNEFSCYPWDQYTRDCFGPGLSYSGFCPDSYEGGASTRRLLESHMITSLMGRRLFGPEHAAKVKGKSWEAISGAYWGLFEGGIYSVPLHGHEGTEEARRKLKELEARGWLDEATSWFGVKLFLLNPDLGIFSHVIINVWFPPSGALIPAVTVTSFAAEPYLHVTALVWDICWLLLWLQLFGRCTCRLLQACFVHKVREHTRDFWVWVDWVSALGGAAMATCWIVFILTLDSVKARTLEVAVSRPSAPAAGAQMTFADPGELREYIDGADRMHAEVASLAAFLGVYRVCLSWYTLLLSLRFFQAFMAQPRLGMVTRTVQRSLVDVSHFLIVLLLFFFSYATAGMFLFGHRMLEFSSFSMAVHTCYLIMLGDFDYEELSTEHPFSAAVWFWTFMMMVVLIMLNMALAIVMDVYTEVKADCEDSDELWTQTRKVVDSVWYRRDWVSLNTIIKQVEKAEGEAIGDRELQDLVDGLGHRQAAELVSSARTREEKAQEKGVSMSDAMKMVGWIKLAVQKVERQVDEVARMEKEERALAAPGAGLEGMAFGDGAGEVLSLDPNADHRLRDVQRRLSRMEDFIGESMASTVGRGKEVRNRLTSIETLLQGQRDFSSPMGMPSLESWEAPTRPSAMSVPAALEAANVRTVTFTA